MTADAHAADIRGVAQRDQDFALAQEVDQRGVFRGTIEREGDDSGAIAALFGRDDLDLRLVKSGDEVIGEREYVLADIVDADLVEQSDGLGEPDRAGIIGRPAVLPAPRRVYVFEVADGRD